MKQDILKSVILTLFLASGISSCAQSNGYVEVNLNLGNTTFNKQTGSINGGDASGKLTILYENYGDGEQYAKTVSNPTNPNEKVLAFIHSKKIKELNVEPKIRVQANTRKLQAYELESYVDVYFPSESFECLNTYNRDIGWLTIQEYWAPFGDKVGTTVTTNPGYRATLGACKFANQQNLYWYLKCENREMNSNGTENYTELKTKTDDRIKKKFPIPYGKWITIHTIIKCGSSSKGRYFMECIVDNKRTIIFDKKIPVGPTIVKNYPNAQETYMDSNTCMMKMYTSAKLANYILENSTSKEMKILWKNLQYNIKSKK